jgi:hypothetical protein
VRGQPWTEGNEALNKCSDSDWKEYVATMSKFSDLVTEAVHSLEMVMRLANVLSRTDPGSLPDWLPRLLTEALLEWDRAWN